MTREEAIALLKSRRDLIKSDYPEIDDYRESLDMAIKALEQESILDKITTEIQRLRGCSCSCSDGIIDDVEDIIDKYKAESEG